MFLKKAEKESADCHGLKRPRRDWRGALSDGLILLGTGLLVLGAFMIWLPAGFFLAGGTLMLLGWLIGVEGGDAV